MLIIIIGGLEFLLQLQLGLFDHLLLLPVFRRLEFLLLEMLLRLLARLLLLRYQLLVLPLVGGNLLLMALNQGLEHLRVL